MRKAFVIALVLTLLPIGVAWSQELPKDGAAVFVAARYDRITDKDEGLFAVSAGVAKSLGFGNLWQFTYLDVGTYGSLSTETAYIIGDQSQYWVGILAGPNVDWQSTPDDGVDGSLAYLTGAAGFVGGVNISDKSGIFGMMKYNFRFSEESQQLYQNGWTAGFGWNFFFE